MNVRRIVSFISVLALLFIGACQSNNTPPNWNFEYPLSVGNSWEYDKTYTADYDEEAEANGCIDATFYGNANVLIKNFETIFDTLDVYNFETTLYESGDIMVSNEYYNVADSCLIEFAYYRGYMFTPKSGRSNLRFKFDGKLYSNVEEIFEILQTGIDFHPRDSIYYDPVTSLDYPLELNKQWTYRTDGLWLIEKQIINQTTTLVPAGTFNCWLIRWTHPEQNWNDDLDFRDYVTEQGLIKRTINFYNIACTDQNGIFVGYVDMYQEHILTDYELTD
jgi:hypothetical protein